MLQNKNVAFFIDVDNLGLTMEQYDNVVAQLEKFGKISFGKIYGARERKHMQLIDLATQKGFRVERSMRIKRRGRKEFDNRIFVDVVETVLQARNVDAVCIVAEPTDMVYLYSFLRSHGVSVIALDNADDESNALIDEVIDVGQVVSIKLPSAKPAKAKEQQPAPKAEPTPVEQPAPESQSKEQPSAEKTSELLREIELLRKLADEQKSEPSQEQIKVEEPKQIVVEQPQVAEEEPNQQIVEEKPIEPQVETPRASYLPQDDSDLVRKIEQLRKNNVGGDDELADEIRKLLDGIE